MMPDISPNNTNIPVMLDVLKEFAEFLFTHKRYWLIPLVFLLLLLSVIIVLTQGSALAPFIYTIF